MTVPRRAALFVDFDNIYLGLRQNDPDAAEEFATHPARWLAWLERYLPEREISAEDPPQRRILLRNCYLNPRSFSRYRSDFIRSAFRVVDCPPLTRQGKTSTDIHLVMDVIDAIAHPTHFEELILLSADADFTPVLLRARVNDRRTVVVSVGPSAPAYRNAADMLIGEDAFVTFALGGTPGGRATEVPVSTADDSVLDEMAAALVETVSDERELLPAAIPRIYVRFGSFRDSTDWLGHWSLRGLTEALVARRPEALDLVETDDEWLVRSAVVPAAASVEVAAAPDTSALAAEIVATVSELVKSSPAPVGMPSAAQHVLTVLGSQVTESNWADTGSFKALLEAAETDMLPVQLSPTRWVIVDPERHELPEPPPAAVGGETASDRLARRVCRTTGAPALSNVQYAALFNALQDALEREAYSLTETSKLVRDLLVERGAPISRTNISFVLRGIGFASSILTEEPGAGATALASAFRRQLGSLCEDADLHLTPEEEASLDSWIVEGVAAAATNAP